MKFETTEKFNNRYTKLVCATNRAFTYGNPESAMWLLQNINDFVTDCVDTVFRVPEGFSSNPIQEARYDTLDGFHANVNELIETAERGTSDDNKERWLIGYREALRVMSLSLLSDIHCCYTTKNVDTLKVFLDAQDKFSADLSTVRSVMLGAEMAELDASILYA